MTILNPTEKDLRRCVACSIDIFHTKEQHDEYLSIWCEQHQSWCGNHTHKSIKEAIDYLRTIREGTKN